MLVVVRQELAESDVAALPPSYGLMLEDQAILATIASKVLLLGLGPDQSPVDVRTQLEDDPRVERVQLNYLYRPFAAAQPGLATAGYATAMLAVERLQQHARGRGVTVALIDTPVDRNHPTFLNARIEPVPVMRGPADPDLHGTAVASAVVAEGVVRGLAPDATLLAIEAVTREQGAGTWIVAQSFFLAKALDLAIMRGARIINVGLGAKNGKQDAVLTQLVDTAVERGSVVVAAAGTADEAGRATYPAALPNVIAVTAVDRNQELSPEASTGPYISLAAPGVDVLAAGSHQDLVPVTGSSIAAAFVSGIVALLLEKRPELDPYAVKVLLEKTADDLGAELGKDDRYGAGLINGVRALERLASASRVQ
jgi:subtilisin family serine protease